MSEFERLADFPGFKESLIGEHWLWAGAVNSNGYGSLGRTAVHVAAFEHFNGPVPTGLHVMHTCDIRLCFHPRHLGLGTREDNMRDMIRKGRGNTQRLTPDQVRDIRRRYVRTSHQVSNKRELAAEFGVSPENVKLIVSRKTWSWIDDD